MFTLPKLPYEYNALEPYIDEQTMRIHHDKHHAAYVNNLNAAPAGEEVLIKHDVVSLMKHLNDVPEAVRTKVRNNGGGHANHAFFWESLICPDQTDSEPDGMLKDAITSTFGNISNFQEKFEKAGMSRFGSGWVWLVVDDEKSSIIDTPNQDNPWMIGKTPILGIDVWEHAYYLKYQNRRADYLKAIWHIVNWKKVGERFQSSISS